MQELPLWPVNPGLESHSDQEFRAKRAGLRSKRNLVMNLRNGKKEGSQSWQVPTPVFLVPEDVSRFPLFPPLPPKLSKKTKFRGTGVAPSVERPTSAKVMISWFVGSSPASGSMLSARNLEPALDSVSPSLSVPSPLSLCLPLSQK